MYAVTVRFCLKPGMIPEFLPLMVENARQSLACEDGCWQFDVLQDDARPDEIFLYEIYEDRAAFDLHLQSAHFLAFDAATGAMVEDKTVWTYTKVLR